MSASQPDPYSDRIAAAVYQAYSTRAGDDTDAPRAYQRFEPSLRQISTASPHRLANSPAAVNCAVEASSG